MCPMTDPEPLWYAQPQGLDRVPVLTHTPLAVGRGVDHHFTPAPRLGREQHMRLDSHLEWVSRVPRHLESPPPPPRPHTQSWKQHHMRSCRNWSHSQLTLCRLLPSFLQSNSPRRVGLPPHGYLGCLVQSQAPNLLSTHSRSGPLWVRTLAFQLGLTYRSPLPSLLLRPVTSPF